MSNRFLLYVAFSLVLFMIWQQWNIEQNPQFQTQSQIEKTKQFQQSEGDIPEEALLDKSKIKGPDQEEPVSNVKNKDENLTIINSDVELTISTQGGTIKKSKLLNYFKTIEEDSENINLFDYEDEYYVAQSGLLHDKTTSKNEKTKLAPNHHDLYEVLNKTSDSVTLKWLTKDKDISVIKKIKLNDAGFNVEVTSQVINNSRRAWAGRQYRQIRRESSSEGRSWVTPTFTGGAYYDGTYNKISYDEISKKKPKLNVQGGWVAMMEHYFVSSWYFSEKENNLFYTKEVNAEGDRKDYIVGARSEALIIQPNENAIFESSLYVGPKLQKELEQISKGLELTIDYGVLTFIAKPLFWLLDKINLMVGNWGWAIILLTILIKLAFYKLSETSYRSMAKMKQFSPKIQSIRERYGSDRQKMNQAMMDMYKQEKINPLGGCWPILIQIPVFIALYWVLLESVELRQAEFIFWLNDLSTKDPYYVLPLIMGASMYFQQKLNPAPPDPMQAKIMQMLPIIFTAFFAFFPSGLVLYWVVNNLLSIAQQWRITKIITSSK